MNKHLKWILPLLILGGFLLRGMLKGGPSESVALPTAVAERGPLRVVVGAFGEVVPRNNTVIVPNIRNTATISYIIPNGSRVAKDEVIARFNTDDLREKIEQLEQQAEDEELALADREAQLLIQDLENTTNLKIAEDDLKSAEMELQKFLEAARDMDRRKAALDVETAQSDLTRAEKRFEDLKALLKEGFITEDEVEEGRITLERARVGVETMRMNKSVLEEYDLPARLVDSENKVSRASTKLEKTRSESRTLLVGKQRQVESTRRNLAKLRQQLEEFRAEMAGFEIRAPVEGVVYFGETDWRRRGDPLQVGSVLRAGQMLCRLPDLSAMRASINVPEADINRLAPGQRVELYVDAVANRKFVGQVVRIAEAASDQGWFSSGVKEFAVEVDLEEFDQLKPGYSCRADIIIAEIPDALLVPQPAVFRSPAGMFVLTSTSAGIATNMVKLGQASLTHVQINDGLEEGVTVMLARPSGSGTP